MAYKIKHLFLTVLKAGKSMIMVLVDLMFGDCKTKSPLKPRSLTYFMFRLSIQNSISFLVPPSFPSGLRNIKEKGGLKLSRILWDLSGTIGFLCSSFLVYRKTGFGLLDLPRVPKSSLKQLTIRAIESEDS